MNSEGLSAQKNVQWCTFFCAYEGKCKGSEVGDQAAGSGGKRCAAGGSRLEVGGRKRVFASCIAIVFIRLSNVSY